MGMKESRVDVVDVDTRRAVLNEGCGGALRIAIVAGDEEHDRSRAFGLRCVSMTDGVELTVF